MVSNGPSWSLMVPLDSSWSNLVTLMVTLMVNLVVTLTVNLIVTLMVTLIVLNGHVFLEGFPYNSPGI